MSSFRLVFLLSALLLTPVLIDPPCSAAAPVDNALQMALLDLLETARAGNREAAIDFLPSGEAAQQLIGLYADREMVPIWVSGRGPGENADVILTALTGSHNEGLDPEKYGVTALHRLWFSNSPGDLAKLEILLTMGLQRYLADMAYGRVEPCLLNPQLFATARKEEQDTSALLRTALQAEDLAAFLQAQQPAHEAYMLLRSALTRYRAIAEKGGWQPVPPGELLRPGAEDSRIGAVRTRLALTGDYAGPARQSFSYDPDLVAAVRKFQARHNLLIDGIIGPRTTAAMNVPVEKRIEQILINMERWRWLPHRLGGRRIFVNIAGFYLQALNDGKMELFMPVIVGEVYHKTPVFSDLIRYLEFNPYWNIPNSIAAKEMLPEIRRNRDYLRQKDIRILDGWHDNAAEIDPATIDWQGPGFPLAGYRLRQEPGPDNALGRVKFMFPNRFNVYLHDTPAHELFKHHNRAFSHGCIRVRHPVGLAYHLLSIGDDSWSMERINSLIEKGERKVVVLPEPIPVHILYRTVMVDPDDGEVFFFADLYDRDSLLAEALFPAGVGAICKYPPAPDAAQEMN